MTDEIEEEDEGERVPDGRTLNWGESPLGLMSPEELLLNAHRIYSAMTSLHSIVRMQMALEEHHRGTLSTYWTRGVGGEAMEKARQVFEILNVGIDSSQHAPMHGPSYYHYADDLLFDITKTEMLGTGWRVCEKCERMTGSKHANNEICTFCKTPNRPLTWDDLRPDWGKVKSEEGTTT